MALSVAYTAPPAFAAKLFKKLVLVDLTTEQLPTGGVEFAHIYAFSGCPPANVIHVHIPRTPNQRSGSIVAIAYIKASVVHMSSDACKC